MTLKSHPSTDKILARASLERSNQDSKDASLPSSSPIKMNSLTPMRLCTRRICSPLTRPLTRSPTGLRPPSFPLARLPRMVSTNAFQFAEGEDFQQLARDAEALLQQGWAQDGDGMGVTKTFHFKSYFKAVVSVKSISQHLDRGCLSAYYGEADRLIYLRHLLI